MLFMLIDAADDRYAPDPEPDDEIARRFAPIRARLFLPAAGSISCVIVSAVSDPLISVLLLIAAVALCVRFVRVALRDDPPPPGHPRLFGTGELE